MGDSVSRGAGLTLDSAPGTAQCVCQAGSAALGVS